MKTIAIIPPGTLPVPPTQGGAVENLIENVCKYNEHAQKVKLVVFSIDNENESSTDEPKDLTEYRYIRIPKFVKRLDRLTYTFANKLFGSNRSSSFRFIWQRIFYIKCVAKSLSEEQFDRIILENHTTLLWALRLHRNYLKYAGSYYYHMHNQVRTFYGCKSVFLGCTAIIGVSRYILNTLPLSIKKNVATVVLQNRVDERSFTNVSTTKKNRLISKYHLQGKKIVLFAGRFNREKGIDKLLLAWKQLQPKHAILLIVGSPYYKSGIATDFEHEMRKLALQMKNSVRFTGYIDYAEMPAIYAISNVVVLPSMWDDPAPLTVIEAITAGKRLITTNSGGIPEYASGKAKILLRDSDLVNRLRESIKFQLDNDTSLVKTNNWEFQEYYFNFIRIMNLGDSDERVIS